MYNLKKLFLRSVILLTILILNINFVYGRVLRDDVENAQLKIIKDIPNNGQQMDINLKRFNFCDDIVQGLKFMKNCTHSQRLKHAYRYDFNKYPGFDLLFAVLLRGNQNDINEIQKYVIKIYAYAGKRFFRQSIPYNTKRNIKYFNNYICV